MRFGGFVVLAAFLWVATGSSLVQAQEIGSGDLRISEGLLKAFAKFQSQPSGLYFAVSTNGWAAGYSVCNAARCKPEDGKRDALKACRKSQGQAPGTCYIFGDRQRVLWRGTIIPTVRSLADNWG